MTQGNSCSEGHTRRHSARCLRDEPEEMEDKGQVMSLQWSMDKRIWERLRGPGAGAGGRKMSARSHSPEGSGQPEREKAVRESEV